MGSSSSYGGSGGSNRGGWKRTRVLIHDLGQGGGGGGAGGPATSEDDGLLADIWNEIADALTSEDPLIDRPPRAGTFTLTDLLPRPRGQRGGGRTGGIVRGTTGASGRRGAQSSRAVVRGAARGGAAIGGAYGLLRGDAAGLAELGLALAELRTLSPRMQCARILDVVVGGGGHPDDTALRRAAAESLKAIILSGQPPNELYALRGFTAHYVFELCLVEIQSDINSGAMDANAAVRMERLLWDYLESRVYLLDYPFEGVLPTAQFAEVARKLTQDAIRVLRAGRGNR